jgi:hypothetical protein
VSYDAWAQIPMSPSAGRSVRFVLRPSPNGKLSRPHRHNAPRDAHSADRWDPHSQHRPLRHGTRATQSHCRLGPTEAPPYGSMASSRSISLGSSRPSPGDRWAAGQRRTGGQHETRNKTLVKSPEPRRPRAPTPPAPHRTLTHLGVGGEASPRPQGRRAMAAMMMTAGESKSPARALRRLAGAAVAAVLLRRSFSASKWYAVSLRVRAVVCFLSPASSSSWRRPTGGYGSRTDGWGPLPLAARRRRGWRRHG